MSDELWQRRAVDLAAMLATGEVSAREVLDAHIARIDAVNPAVKPGNQLRSLSERMMKRAPVSASVPSITTMYTVIPRTRAAKSLGSSRSRSGRRTTMSKRRSPSNNWPAVSPPIAVATASM